MKIKTSLKQLMAYFHQSASTEELSVPVRRFAAQMTVLTAHLMRLEDKLDGAAKTVDGQITELAAHIAELKNPAGAAAAPEEAQSNGDNGKSEEEAATEMAEKLLRETEEEAATLTKPASLPPTPPAPAQKPALVPIRKTGEAS